MSDIDWSKAPEGADKLEQHRDDVAFVNDKGEVWCPVDKRWVRKATAWQTIATRPTTSQAGQRKTFEDAVAAKSEWATIFDKLIYSISADKFVECSASYPLEEGNEYQVCTREEFDACVAAKSEPEWTHEFDNSSPRKLKIVCDEPDHNGEVAILVDGHNGAMYSKTLPERIRPIKPTITKAEAFDRMKEYGWSLPDTESKYTVVSQLVKPHSA